MLWMLPLAGAAIGALSNRKNPLQGALMGAGIGATGGLLAPAGAAAAGAAGTGAASAASGAGAAGLLGDATAAGYGGLGASSAASLGGGAAVNGGAALGGNGLLGADMMGKLKMAGDAASSAGNVMSAVKAVSPQQQPTQPSPMVNAPGYGPQALAQLATSADQQMSQQMQQAEAMRKKRRAGLLGVA